MGHLFIGGPLLHPTRNNPYCAPERRLPILAGLALLTKNLIVEYNNPKSTSQIQPVSL